MTQRQMISLLVNNSRGVLLRVAGLFTRRGFNIESITASPTQDEGYSRITVVINGDNDVAEQFVRQMLKLQDVMKAIIIPQERSLEYELMLVKVLARPAESAIVHKIAYLYHSRVIDVGQYSMTLQAVGTVNELRELVTHLEKQGILELVSTGITALQKGDDCITDGNEE